MAVLILSVGSLGVATLIGRAATTTLETKAREGATNLAREVVEQTLSLPYSTVTPDQLTAALQAKPALAPTGGYTGWTVLRRSIPYAVTVSECYVDDPLDGRGAHPANYCTGSASGTVDAQPIDYKRVSVTVSWTRKNITRSTTQTTLIAPKGSKEGPAITSLTSSSGLTISDPSTTSVNFTATTSASATGTVWTLDDDTQGLATGSGTSWSFTWNLSGLADGNYVIGAQAYNSAGSVGTPMSLSITLNRNAPSAPQGFVAGYNATTQKVESEWLASPDLDTVGYTVYRRQTAPTLGAIQQVNCGTVASPVYVTPETECTDASPITTSPGAGTIGFRAATGNTNGTTTTTSSLTINKPTGVVSGDFLVATIVVQGAPGVNAPAGWSLIRDSRYGTSGEMTSFYHRAGSSEPSSYTFTVSGTNKYFITGGISAFTNVDTTSPIDVSGATTGSSGNAVSPNLTTNYNNDRVINVVGIGVGSAATVTPAAGLTERYDVYARNMVQSSADGTQSNSGATGTKTAVPSQASLAWLSQLIALKPAGSSSSLAVNYWVVGVDRNSSGAYREGPASNVVNAYAANTAPFPITSLFTCTNNADGSNTLNWTQPAQPGDADTGDFIAFDRIYRDGVRFDRTGAGTDSTFTDPLPDASDVHTYYVTTVDTHLAEGTPTGTVTC